MQYFLQGTKVPLVIDRSKTVSRKQGGGFKTRLLKLDDFKMILALDYFFGTALGAWGILGADAGAAFTSSNSTSKISVAPPGIIGGLP